MISIIKKVADKLQNRERISYRDRRGHYASSALSCLRDQYWGYTGEPETNPPDLKACASMAMGDYIERGFIDNILKKLGEQGVIVVGTQVAVGGTDPDWNGYLDALCKYLDPVENKFKTFVLEHKVKSGVGADILLDKLEVQDDHLCQLGLYLKDLSEKGITDEGCLYYTLLSDSNYGKQLQVSCRYDRDNQTIRAFRADFLDGSHTALQQTFDVKIAINRWKELDGYIRNQITPKPDFKYKYELTDELLRSISDGKLKKAIDGQVILGDWQPLYSRYKDKALKIDGISAKRTDEEIQRMKSEYKRRHPKSKIS